MVILVLVDQQHQRGDRQPWRQLVSGRSGGDRRALFVAMSICHFQLCGSAQLIADCKPRMDYAIRLIHRKFTNMPLFAPPTGWRRSVRTGPDAGMTADVGPVVPASVRISACRRRHQDRFLRFAATSDTLALEVISTNLESSPSCQQRYLAGAP